MLRAQLVLSEPKLPAVPRLGEMNQGGSFLLAYRASVFGYRADWLLDILPPLLDILKGRVTAGDPTPGHS